MRKAPSRRSARSETALPFLAHKPARSSPARRTPQPAPHSPACTWESGRPRQLTAQRRKLTPQNPRPLRLAFLGKHHGEIAHAHSPQSHVQKIDNPGEANAHAPRQRPRENTEDFYERPGCRVLKSLPHFGKRNRNTVDRNLQIG